MTGPMTSRALAECEMGRAMPATLQAAEDFFLEFRRRSQALLGPPDYFVAELLLREALTIAVVHGCQGDPGRRVRCRLRLKGGRLLIAVGDDGDGFDWRAAWSGPVAAQRGSGRGIAILRRYADHVRFNGRGNAVTLVRRFCRGKHQ